MAKAAATALQVHLEAFPSGKQIRFVATLRNASQHDLVLLQEEPTVATARTRLIEFRVVETETPPLMFYYAYTPALETLAPGSSHTRRFSHTTPTSGRHRFRFTCGYLDAPFVPVSADPRGDFVRRQRLAHSRIVELTIR